ncbi:Holin of 3TMs, for gene-transfer release (fragment) [Nitrosomonas nitrosa]|uniref:Holin of 3TMs, for gene-transfer release n=1 Tax=Nitrosomonas nitrosa TaxID=52442 RepID=A0A8H9DA11_9PROT
MQTNLSAILAEASSTELWTRWERPAFLYVIYGVILLC